MDNEEKNIEENKELSLQEQLEAQDEFAFLDENPEQDTVQSQDKNEDFQEVQQDDESIEKDIQEESEEDFKDFEDFSDEQIEDIMEEPEIEAEKDELFEDIKEDDELNFENQENSLITVRPVKFQQFEDTPPNRTIKKNLDLIQDISMHISVELGRTKTSIREVMELEKGSIVELDKIAGEQVEILVNQKLVAKGEVIVIEDKFGVRVTNTTNPKPQ